MDYDIYPLALTQVDWRIFIDTCNTYLGFSPSRGIDASPLDIQDPAAALGSLDMNNAPLDALRDAHSLVHDHFSASFLMVLDFEGYAEVLGTGLRVLVKSAKRNYICVVSGTVADWRDAIIRGCRNDATHELRSIMNCVLGYFEQTGLREVVSDYSKQPLRDGTFILRT